MSFVKEGLSMDNEIDVKYVAEIQKYPLLTSEQELELSKKISAGDKLALKSLINSNLRLVVSVSHHFNSSHVPMMDLIQEGNMGLMIAAEKFHYSFKTRFSTYAYPWIMQYMLRYANSRHPLIVIPHRKDDMIRKIESSRASIFLKTGKEPSYEEISEEMKIPVEKVIEYLSFNYTVSSLDVETGCDDNSVSIVDMLSDTTYSPEISFIKEEDRQKVRSLLDALPHNERKVLWYRYNFDGANRAKTLREISSIIGVTPEAVRQTEIRAIRHLRQAAETA